jgi:NADPH:quinone reductase-like Zn-dependent oxidoreductase
VREVGSKVTRVKEGDMVMALLPSGGYAECNTYQNNNKNNNNNISKNRFLEE